MIQWQGSYCGPVTAPAGLLSRSNFNPFALMILAAPARCAGRTRPGVAGIVWVFLAYLAMGMLGAILTLAPGAVHATHAIAPFMWGLTPLSDQQLGGLIMWMPAGLPFAVWGGLLARRAWREMGEAL